MKTATVLALLGLSTLVNAVDHHAELRRGARALKKSSSPLKDKKDKSTKKKKEKMPVKASSGGKGGGKGSDCKDPAPAVAAPKGCLSKDGVNAVLKAFEGAVVAISDVRLRLCYTWLVCVGWMTNGGRNRNDVDDGPSFVLIVTVQQFMRCLFFGRRTIAVLASEQGDSRVSSMFSSNFAWFVHTHSQLLLILSTHEYCFYNDNYYLRLTGVVELPPTRRSVVRRWPTDRPPKRPATAPTRLLTVPLTPRTGTPIVSCSSPR